MSLFIFIVGKFEEIETKIPKAGKLNEKHATPSKYTTWQYLQMEISLLEFFQWNIAFPTAAHFRDYYLHVAVADTDYHGEQPIIEVNKTKNYMKKYVNYFLEISLQGECFRKKQQECQLLQQLWIECTYKMPVVSVRRPK